MQEWTIVGKIHPYCVGRKDIFWIEDTSFIGAAMVLIVFPLLSLQSKSKRYKNLIVNFCNHLWLISLIFPMKVLKLYLYQPIDWFKPRTTEVHGRMTHWEFLKIRTEQRYQNIILITFQHLKKLYSFWKLWGCSS